MVPVPDTPRDHRMPTTTTERTGSGISRRRLFGGGLGLGALSALSATGLSACSNEGRGGDALGDNTGVELPTYTAYDGVPLDLEGDDENGISGAMLAYPENPEKVTDGPPGDGEDIGFFVMTNTPAPPSMDDNEFWQGLNERLDCTASISLVPTGDFADRFQTTIAGDKLPDVFSYFPGDVPSLPSMLAERATDLTDLLSGDAVTNYPFLAAVPAAAWRSCLYGGKIYCIPVPRGVVQSSVMYQRVDLMEDEGLEINTESWEGFYDSCKELTGGKRWALPNASLGFVRQMFEIPNGWSDDGGTLTSANEHERQEEALEATRKLVEDGLTHPDAFTVDQPQRKTWVVNGTCPMIFDTLSAWPDFENFPLPEGFDLGIVEPPLAEGGGVAPVHKGPYMHNITSISKNAEGRAEALLEVLNYLAAPFGSEEYLFKMYGAEGVHYELKGSDPILTEQGRTEVQLGLKYMAQGPWVNYSPGNPDTAQAQYDAEQLIGPTAIANPVEGLYSETQSRKGNQIGTALADVETDILQGRKKVSAWADAVATWKKGGGDKMRDEYQEALAEVEEADA